MISAQQKAAGSVLEYMGREEHNVAKEFTKHADANPHTVAGSMFCKGIHYQELGRMTAFQAKGEVESALRIACSATAYSKNQHYYECYEWSTRRYLGNGEIEDQQGNAEKEGDKAEADADYEEQEEQDLYVWTAGNFLFRGWRSRRRRYASRLAWVSYWQRQRYSYQPWTSRQESVFVVVHKVPLRQRKIVQILDWPTSTHHKLIMGTVIDDDSIET